MEARGKVLIKIAGILMLIGAILGLIVSVAMMFMSGSIVEYLSLGEAYQYVMLIVAVSAIESIIMLVIAIFGIKHAGHIEAADGIIKRGIFLVVLSLLSMTGMYFMDGFELTQLTSLILPILYIVGGKMNKAS